MMCVYLTSSVVTSQDEAAEVGGEAGRCGVWAPVPPQQTRSELCSQHICILFNSSRSFVIFLLES